MAALSEIHQWEAESGYGRQNDKVQDQREMWAISDIGTPYWVNRLGIHPLNKLQIIIIKCVRVMDGQEASSIFPDTYFRLGQAGRSA